MSANGTLPERGPASNAPLANLARRLVGWTSPHPLKIIIAFVILTAISGGYVARNFSINTDVNALISADLPGDNVSWPMRRLFRKARKGSSRSSTPRRRNSPTPPQPL